jgi:hypothetical protein
VKWSHLIVGLLCVVNAVAFVVGGERLALSGYCEFRHFIGEGNVSVGDLRLKLPGGWCPIGSNSKGVTLTSVPVSRNDEPIVALESSPIPERMESSILHPSYSWARPVPGGYEI